MKFSIAHLILNRMFYKFFQIIVNRYEGVQNVEIHKEAEWEKKSDEEIRVKNHENLRDRKN